MAKQGSQQVYNTMPKSREWLIVNYIINVVGTTLLGFYIFRGEKIHDDYIQLYKLGKCMAMQSKAWMTTYLSKKFFRIFSKS